MNRAVDRGFWFSWYDLPREPRRAYRLAARAPTSRTILRKPGVLWGAHYKTVVTAPGSHMIRTKDPACRTAATTS